MRKAMAEAEVGDDVFREDPTVTRLQERAAEIMGKEAALFVPSGTMGNQIAVRLHTQPGQEVVIEERGHIFNWEMAMMAAFSGCVARPVQAPRGILTWERIEPALAPSVYYRARTGLIALENTHNMAGGTVMKPEESRGVWEAASRRGIPVHLDGARIFNAAIALGCPPADLARWADSVMFCLSKGLCAPVGSLLVGSKAFIDEAWRVRKMLGGGMRQVGILASAGLIALEEMPARLHEDHANARLLAEGLCQVPGVEVAMETVVTNIVIADLRGITSRELLSRLEARGVRAVAPGTSQVRFVTHKDVSKNDVEEALRIIGEVMKNGQPAEG